jgi:hypothetical protein
MKKKKVVEIPPEIPQVGELVRYFTEQGWHIGTLVKKVGKRFVISPVAAYHKVKGKRWNVWVPLTDVQKLPPRMANYNTPVEL